MRSAECEHCKSWVRYDASRFECARALSGFGCAFESRDGWKPKTYADLEKENADLEQQIEKMKCGQNCKHLYINLCDLNFRTCSNCKDKWEIK